LTTGHSEDACKILSNSVHGVKLKPGHIYCIAMSIALVLSNVCKQNFCCCWI